MSQSLLGPMPEARRWADQPPVETPLVRRPLPELAAACRREAAAFARGESCRGAAALELFRRAVCGRDAAAWAAILAEYRGLVLAWVRRHPAAARLDGDDDDRVCRVFERFWAAVPPERWDRFTELPALLGYLKLCAHSVVLDAARARHPAVPLDTVAGAVVDPRDPEAGALGELAGRELWGLVLRLLPDLRERVVAELSLVQNLTPREIRTRHPGRFATVGEVYRLKRNVLERLRRSPELRRALGGGGPAEAARRRVHTKRGRSA